MSDVGGIRWRWLRFMYLYTILGAGGFGLTMLAVPEKMRSVYVPWNSGGRSLVLICFSLSYPAGADDY